MKFTVFFIDVRTETNSLYALSTPTGYLYFKLSVNSKLYSFISV